MRIEPLPITHPDAARLVEEVQEEYVVRYGSRDATPLDDEEFTPGRGRFLVGYLDLEPVSIGGWRWHADVDGAGPGPTAEIKRMYVAAGHRGAGHARRMLRHLELSAAADGARVLILETGIRQPEAIALYESSGYRPVPGFGHYRNDGLSRCYAKVLGSSSD
ncbi:GNAT family N-acetyltransferase [Nocardioides sp.]|uniref:GNAT family N-acetyltransferase n=1 Tax=Nocardioides sp. TaxID=35761 RepID=UPI003D103672